MQRILFLFLFTAIFLFCETADFSVQQVLAQNYAKEDEKALIAEKERQKFLTEMQTLLNAASKAGFSEKEIREITVTRKGKVVHVWDFLEQAKLQQKKDALAKKRSKPRERYLTVMDIAEEMQSGETRDLDAIKDKSTFIGAEEK
jgi:acetyl-CoA acetyltransferase